MAHLGAELWRNTARVVASTKYGQVRGGRASNGAAVFLGDLGHPSHLRSYSVDAPTYYQKFLMH